MKLVLTTFGNAEDAARVIRTLVGEKVAACGTILPGARSIYQWEGQIEDTTEAAVLLKTADSRVTELETRLAELHPYSTPEIVTLSPESVSARYASWVEGSCAR
jgi:periplasmic divalent cation tolerance protein